MQLVVSFFVCFDINAIFGDVLILAQHGAQGHDNAVQAQKASVVGVISHFGPKVTDFNAGQGAVVLVAQLNVKRVNTVLLAVNDQLSVDERVRRYFAESLATI